MPDPYFVYDYLENLGEVKTTSYIKIHNIIWFSHTQALGNSKDIYLLRFGLRINI